MTWATTSLFRQKSEICLKLVDTYTSYRGSPKLEYGIEQSNDLLSDRVRVMRPGARSKTEVQEEQGNFGHRRAYQAAELGKSPTADNL